VNTPVDVRALGAVLLAKRSEESARHFYVKSLAPDVHDPDLSRLLHAAWRTTVKALDVVSRRARHGKVVQFNPKRSRK